MDIWQRHEVFEIEVLDSMNSARLLDPLVFGGGTMLRLCHELPRYSIDLDFWLVRKIAQKYFFDKTQKVLEKKYEVTDAQMNHFTLLFELRTARYPKRLKIEIRREGEKSDTQEKIAFSRLSNQQVVLKAHTLEQTMRNKIKAFLDREEIRDGFDIEFLLRKGVALDLKDEKESLAFREKLARLKERDFKVKLGSILEGPIRQYYVQHRFSFLEEKLSSIGIIGLGSGDGAPVARNHDAVLYPRKYPK
jgi:Nucleotidyl transferase AbiEii toxin, Type IV TA system